VAAGAWRHAVLRYRGSVCLLCHDAEAITFLQGFLSDIVKQQWTMASICRLSLTCFSGSACLRTTPLCLFLAKLGIISYKTAVEELQICRYWHRRCWLPPSPTVDPLNMALVMGPLILLYLLGILLAKIA